MAILNKSCLSVGGDLGTPIGPAGDRYTQAWLWESATEGDWVAQDYTHELECYSGVYNGFSQAGSTADETHNLHIYAEEGSRHLGIPRGNGGSGVQFTGASGFICVINALYTTLEGVELLSSGASEPPLSVGGDSCKITRNILYDPRADSHCGVINNASPTTQFYCNLIIGGNLGLDNMIGVDNCFNNTASVVAKPYSTSATLLFNNNITYASSGDYGGGNWPLAGSTNNATGDPDPAWSRGDNGIANVSIVDGVDFVSPSTLDFNILQSGKLYNAGTDTSSLVDLDIAYNPFTTPDVGCFAYVSAGPPAVLTLPTVTDITGSGATIGCTTDTAGGTLYWYVSTSATAPSVSDLKSGAGSTDFGNLVPVLGANTAAVTGLAETTDYYHYWLQET